MDSEPIYLDPAQNPSSARGIVPRHQRARAGQRSRACPKIPSSLPQESQGSDSGGGSTGGIQSYFKASFSPATKAPITKPTSPVINPTRPHKLLFGMNT